jgi:hypothetical protein
LRYIDENDVNAEIKARSLEALLISEEDTRKMGQIGEICKEQIQRLLK